MIKLPILEKILVNLNSLPNQIGLYTRKSPTSNAWINGRIIVLVSKDSVSFGTAVPIGALFKRVNVSSNEEAIAAIKKGWKK